MALIKMFNYRYNIFCINVFLCLVTITLSWTPINENVVITPTTHKNMQMKNEARNFNVQKTYKNNEVSPYIDLVLCPLHVEPWTCARQQSARLLDIWNGDLYSQWQKLKVEADLELNVTLEKRGYSESETMSSKEKPSSILKKIEIGTNYMKDYLSKTMDGFLGNELEPMAKTQTEEEEEEQEEEEEVDDEEEDAEEEDDEEKEEDSVPIIKDGHKNDMVSTASADTEFIELSSSEKNEAGKDKGQRKKKHKKNKKGQAQAAAQPATVVLLQQPAAPIVHHADDHEEYEHGGAGTEVVHVYHEGEQENHGHGHGKPNKMKHRKQKRQKKRKNKRKQQHEHGLLEADDDALSSLLHNQHPTGGLGLGLLDELISSDDWLVDGGKRKKGQATNYGRSIGVMRGKKKKKKKALMKLVLLGSFLKAKIELLLKILGAHLQIKFFAIALIGLLINIARFWIDVKRGGSPQKVVYVEHAHHQHHYEDHGEEWNEPGGYWKRSLPGDSITDENSVTDSYMPQDDAHYLAYRNQWTK